MHAALISESYLRERLAHLGGQRSELLSHTVTTSGARMVMRQGIDGQHLPSTVKRIAPDGVQIERTESWSAAAPYLGTIGASVQGMPGSLTGTSRLTDRAGGSELVLLAEVRVNIPLVGGKVETVIVEQLSKLLAAEAEFTSSWLGSR